MEITFHNVTIVIEADSPEAAYTILCDGLARGLKRHAFEYAADTFTTDEEPGHNDVSALYPNMDEVSE